MIKMYGENSKITIMTDVIEDTAKKQLERLLSRDWFKNHNATIMPDVHAGAESVIGLTMKLISNTVSPDFIGSDIGCGVTLVRTNIEIDDNETVAKKIDSIIKNMFSDMSTFGIDDDTFELLSSNLYYPLVDINLTKTFGTLGGGNHFIEAYNENGKLSISVHSGSRHLGGVVYKHYKRLAKRNPEIKNKIKELIVRLKENKQEYLIESEIQKYKESYKANKLDFDMLEKDDYDDYVNDVDVMTIYAKSNRLAILEKILFEFETSIDNVEIIDKPHNYIESALVPKDENLKLEGEFKLEDFIAQDFLRKGAQSAYLGEKVLIPINMRDGLIVGTVKLGKSYGDWNNSAPHGAGRVLSRTAAKKTLSMSEFKNQMTDVYSTSVDESTLDEAPEAYKKIDKILSDISDLIEVDSILKPFYNYKGE